MSSPYKILVVDDDRAARMALEIPLRLGGYEVTSVPGGRQAVSLSGEKDFDVILTDIYMPDLNGLEVIRHFRQAQPRSRIIAVTAQGSIETAMQAIADGAFDFIAKPFNIDDLLTLVGRASGYPAVPASTPPGDQPDWSPSGLVGHSPQIVRAYKLAAQAAASDATVLIEGESGTGKELLARAIHQHGQRAHKPFTAINCSAMTETLLESELFGYTRGSFTGAISDRPGLFEATNGGTLFLDELGGISPAFQALLLRVLQEKEVRRIGSRETRQVDVRIIAATNASLDHLVTQKLFRPDLFYRLSVLTINLPPLRLRGGDEISLLVYHFLHKLDPSHSCRISQDALDLLTRYHWPGNVRELENCLLYAITVCSARLITLSDLPERVVKEAAPEKLPGRLEDGRMGIAGGGVTLIEDRPRLEELERRYIRLVLAENEGNKTRAAEVLGIDRRTIYRYLEVGEGED